MNIDRPKQPGDYPEREFDCARALKQAFDQEAEHADTAYLDIQQICSRLTDSAIAAGWTEPDIVAAIVTLADNRQRSDHDIRRIEPDNQNMSVQ